MKREYYICNPLTRQWVMLPPVILPLYDNEANCCTALICEEPPSENVKHDYRFRVVVMFFPRLELMVFCSEIGQWKNILLTLVQTTNNMTAGNEGVVAVCNKIVYFGYKSRFGEFDPFCDTSTVATLEAKSLPALRSRVSGKMKLAECRDRLLGVVVNPYNLVSIWRLSDKANGSSGRRWEMERSVYFSPIKLGLEFDQVSVELAGVHPKNEKKDEIYLVVKYSSNPDQAEQLVACECLCLQFIKLLTTPRPQQLVACEPGSRSSACHRPVKPPTPRLQRGSLSSARHRLELLPSPTPTPTPTPLPRMTHS